MPPKIKPSHPTCPECGWSTGHHNTTCSSHVPSHEPIEGQLDCHNCGQGGFLIVGADDRVPVPTAFYKMALFCTDTCLSEWVDRLHEPVKLVDP